MTGTIVAGHDASYYTKGGTSADSYYTGGSGKDDQGEPPGRWYTTGTNRLGLQGDVTAEAMKALYTQGLDPRDPRFWSQDPQERAQCARLGSAPKTFKTSDELTVEKLAAAGGLDDVRLAELRNQARAVDLDARENRGKDRQAILVGLVTEAAGILPEDAARIRQEAEQQTRQAVSFMDATYSPPKSVTVYHTALARAENEAARAGRQDEAGRYRALREDVEASIYEASEQFIEHLWDRAGYARTGKHGGGAGRWERTEGWTVAQFFQHSSREGDPQLHVHGAILNKQVCADGKVRALDTALVMANKQGAGTIADVALSQAITRRHAARGVGIRWQMRADGVGREIVGVDQEAMDLFSKRTKNMGPRLVKLVDRFRAATGREPNALEQARLSKAASLGTRKAKAATPDLTRPEQLDKWDAELRAEVVTGLTTVAARVASGQVTGQEPEQWSPAGVVAEAVATCQEKRAAWSRTELERQIGLALPDNLGAELQPGQVRSLISRLADDALSNEHVVRVSGQEMSGDALPDDFRLQSGASSYVNPAAARYATEGHIVAEQAIRRSSILRDRLRVDRRDVDAWISDRGQTLGSLGQDQRAAIRGILTSGANITALIGPAGAGKSFTMGAVSAAWQDLTGRKVVGVATSEAATNVLRDEGLTAKNITQWLDAQEAIAAGRANQETLRWTVGEGDLVVVDEAAMVDHGTIERIREIVEHRRARIVLTGDPAQLGAIGAGGTMSMIAETEGADVHTLAEVRRFESSWEGAASLRLRAGDVDVVAEYDRRGRIVDCGTLENAMRQAAASYVAEHIAGKDAVVVVGSNERAAEVSGMVRAKLVELGEVQPDGVLLRDGTSAGVGDLIQARRNDWQLGVTNRRRYQVREAREDGSLVAEATDGSGVRVIPAEYVTEDVTLGYAGTVHAVQGLTVDVCDPVIEPGMPLEAGYPSLTRGRERNTARVVTQPEAPGEMPGETHARERVTAAGVIRDMLQRGVLSEDAAMVQAEEELAEHGSNHLIHARHEDAMRHVSRVRTAQWLDELAAEGVITAEDRERFAADQGTEQLGRLLRTVEQAGHDPQQALREACRTPFTGLRSVAQGVQGRIRAACGDELKPAVEQMEAAVPAGLQEPMQRYVGRLAEMADDRRRELGSQVAEEAPRWAVETLGPVPHDVVARMEWEAKAGIVAAHREATGHTDETNPLPPAPGLSATELRASWHAAWAALGRPEAGSEETDLSDGLLRVRVKAWEREQAWAPRYVDDEMRATGQKLVEYRHQATILQRQADLAEDPADRARLQAEADEKFAQGEVMAGIEQDLSQLADDRAAWFAETAVTRAAALRAAEELSVRGRPIGDEADRVTAEEWLQAHDEAMRAEDPHRQITEHDIQDDDEIVESRSEDSQEGISEGSKARTFEDANRPAELVEGGNAGITAHGHADQVEDLDEPRPATAAEPDDAEPDRDRVALPDGVPSVGEVEVSLTAAKLAAQEIADRRSAEEAHAEDEHTAAAERELAWRRDEQQAADRAHAAEVDAGAEEFAY